MPFPLLFQNKHFFLALYFGYKQISTRPNDIIMLCNCCDSSLYYEIILLISWTISFFIWDTSSASSTTTTPSTTTIKTVQQSSKVTCDPVLEDFLPNPDDCHSYFTCTQGVAYLTKCAPGVTFTYNDTLFCDCGTLEFLYLLIAMLYALNLSLVNGAKQNNCCNQYSICVCMDVNKLCLHNILEI